MIKYKYACGCGEMADAHGSGPCGAKPMLVQIQSSAPIRNEQSKFVFILQNYSSLFCLTFVGNIYIMEE